MLIKRHILFRLTLHRVKGTVMDDNQTEFGYTPHNLRYVLRFSGVTQNYAGELINKARSTFGRYLYDMDHENHVSMSHRDWLQLLQKLKIPQQNFIGTRLKMNAPIGRTDINLTIPTTKFFIGMRNANKGHYLPQITGDQTKAEFVDFMKNELCADMVTKDDLTEFTLNTEKLLRTVVNEIKAHINNVEQRVFQRIIDHDHAGFLTVFNAYFDRIVSSEYKSYEELGAKVLPLNTHFLKAFEETKGYYFNLQVNRNQRHSPEYLSDIDSVEEYFSEAITTLVMYLAIEYFGDKKSYHKNNNYVKSAIDRMDKHILKLIAVDVNSRTRLIDQYLIERAINNPAEFHHTQKILGFELTATEYADLLFKSLQNKEDLHEYGRYNIKKYDLILLDSKEVNDYFKRLVKLYGALNFIREINDKLANSSSNGETGDVDVDAHASFKILLNTASQVQSNALQTANE